MGSAELINSELKCLDRWLKSNKISINADKCIHFNVQEHGTKFLFGKLLENIDAGLDPL